MKNKFGQTQSAYNLLAEAYSRVLRNMRERRALSAGALLAVVGGAALALAPQAGAATL